MKTSPIERTRARIMAEALRLLHERGPSAAVTHIKLSSVLRRAGLTTGAAYRIWPDQAAFHHDLALAAVQFRTSEPSVTTAAAVVPVLMSDAHSDTDLFEAIRLGSEANLRSYPSDIAFLTTLAIRASSYDDDDLVAAGVTRHTEAIESYSALYRVVLAWSRRRLRPGFTLEDAAGALAAISEGFGLQQATGVPPTRLDLNAAADGPGEVPWSLMAVCAVAVVERMTEPDPDAPYFDPAQLPAEWLTIVDADSPAEEPACARPAHDAHAEPGAGYRSTESRSSLA